MKNYISLQVPVEKDAFDRLPADFYQDEEKDTRAVGYWKAAWLRLKKNRIAMTALVIILLITLFAVVGPLLSPYTYDQQVHGDENLFPCAAHPFGTDRLGRDLMVRCMIGTRISLLVGVVSAFIVMVIGSIYGAISGLCGGKVDLVMMRVVDVIYSVPEILLIVVIKLVIDEPLSHVAALQKIGSGLIAIFIVYGCLYWVGMARLIRGQILSIKENEYILAARSIGAKPGRIIRRHILPNCLSVIIISAALQVPSAIFTESYLSFLGLGVRAPMPSLGSLANSAREGLQSYPYKLVFPAVMICLIVLSLNLLGDGLRDAFDPKLKR